MQEKSRLLVVDQSYSPIESLENEALYRHGISGGDQSGFVYRYRWSSPPGQGSKESVPYVKVISHSLNTGTQKFMI